MYDGLTAGAAGATVSAIASIYNTGAWYANKIFDAGVEEMDTARTLRDLDTNWAQYYEQNKEVLDTVGFIGGSFIPGGAAIKLLRLAQKLVNLLVRLVGCLGLLRTGNRPQWKPD